MTNNTIKQNQQSTSKIIDDMLQSFKTSKQYMVKVRDKSFKYEEILEYMINYLDTTINSINEIKKSKVTQKQISKEVKILLEQKILEIKKQKLSDDFKSTILSLLESNNDILKNSEKKNEGFINKSTQISQDFISYITNIIKKIKNTIKPNYKSQNTKPETQTIKSHHLKQEIDINISQSKSKKQLLSNNHHNKTTHNILHDDLKLENLDKTEKVERKSNSIDRRLISYKKSLKSDSRDSRDSKSILTNTLKRSNSRGV